MPMPSNGSIQPGHEYWLAYPWDVPDCLTSSACLVRVAKYTDRSLNDESELFAVAPSSRVSRTEHDLHIEARVYGIDACDVAGRQVYRSSLGAPVSAASARAAVMAVLSGGTYVVKLFDESGNAVPTRRLLIR